MWFRHNKFRTYHPIKDDWIYWSPNEDCTYASGKDVIFIERWAGPDNWFSKRQFQQQPHYQWTGFRDIDNKMVWEGDILLFEGKRKLVRYRNGGFTGLEDTRKQSERQKGQKRHYLKGKVIGNYFLKAERRYYSDMEKEFGEGSVQKYWKRNFDWSE